MADKEPNSETFLLGEIQTNKEEIWETIQWLRPKKENRLFWAMVESLEASARARMEAAKPTDSTITFGEWGIGKEMIAENLRTIRDIRNIEKQLQEIVK